MPSASPCLSRMSPSADSCEPTKRAMRAAPRFCTTNGATPTSSPSRSATTMHGSDTKLGSASHERTQVESRYGLGRGAAATSASQAAESSCASWSPAVRVRIDAGAERAEGIAICSQPNRNPRNT